MRNIPANALFSDRTDSEPRRPAFEAESDHEPPAPAAIFARLGALIAIALVFAVAAQFLLGATH